jgi:hypothetical protein
MTGKHHGSHIYGEMYVHSIQFKGVIENIHYALYKRVKRRPINVNPHPDAKSLLHS